MIAIDEIETGRGKNQIGTLKRSGSTRWSSYLASIDSLLRMYEDTCVVLIEIINEGKSSSQKCEADTLYDTMTSFEFVFILHLMRDVLGYADLLCQALQCKSQDILNAMDLVEVTKLRLQRYRDDEWSQLLGNVKKFCGDRNISIPDMDAIYTSGRGRRKQRDHVTNEHHYKVDVFLVVLDIHLHELNTRFNKDVIELLNLSTSLHPRDGYKTFNIERILELASKFYPMDFTDQDLRHLRIQLEFFHMEVVRNSRLQNLSSLPELCQVLAETRKANSYSLLDRLIRLILTLPVSTATTERVFSVMKIIKTDLRNRMEDEFLASTMIMYIEKEIAQKFDTDSIIEDFDKLKKRRVQFQMPKIH